MSLAGSAARGGAAILAGQAARAILQLISVVVLARLLSPSDFGLVGMVAAVIGLAAVFGDFGLSLAAVQSQVITRQQESNLFWTNAFLGISLFALTLGLASPLASFYDQPQVEPVAQVLAWTFLLNALSAQFRAQFTKQLRFVALTTIEIAGVAGGLCIAIALASIGAGYWSLVAQQVSASVFTLVGVAAFSKWFPGLPRRAPGMRSLYSYGANTLGVQVLTYVTSNAGSLIIGRFSSVGAVGSYDRANQLLQLPLQQIASPLTRLALPILSRTNNDRKFARLLAQAQLMLAYIFIGVFAILVTLAGSIVDLVLGPGWDEAADILQVLAVGGIFQGIGYVYFWVFLARAMTGIQLRWSLVTRLLTLCAMLGGAHFGAIGVAAGLAFGQGLNWILLTIFPMRRTGVSIVMLLGQVVRPLIVFVPPAVAGIALRVLMFQGEEPFVYRSTVLVGFLVWMLILLLFPEFRRDVARVIRMARLVFTRD